MSLVFKSPFVYFTPSPKPNMGEAGNLDMSKGSCMGSEAKMKFEDIPRERAFTKLYSECRTVPLYIYDHVQILL